MPINLKVIQDLVKSYDDYKTELARQLNLAEIAKLEAEQHAREEAAKAAAAKVAPGPAR